MEYDSSCSKKQMNVNKPAPLKTTRYFTSAVWPLGMKFNLMSYGKRLTTTAERQGP